ncbi:ketosteroid isomerase-like protein [Murinocardiopsis flavida]|uniref:Ketosteroid isomerase-like protein n=1 Tax=Murinocardiopsis flavida TaxID=645275 RepID=A0A2P8D912_9ACTN|nr:nuclear transport factor 2 family protein [Murinocardiopsis flavida]PSK93692.1 ketosteroid isomerase-like protein [Murinocardiopsis flavida]
MSDTKAIADRFEIEALRGEYADAAMMGDYDRLASLFTHDALLRIPTIAEFTSREEIRAGIERLRSNWEVFMHLVHPGTIQVDGDTATGRTYITETGRFHDGRVHLNHSIYHDRYRRTPDGWQFTQRIYEVRYREDDGVPVDPMSAVSL